MDLPRDRQPWEYLKKRGIEEDTVVKNMIGFSSGEGLYEHLTREGYLHSIIFQKKLCRCNKNKDLGTREMRDFFGKGRITIPCLWTRRVLNIVGRICYHTDNKAIPRYKVLTNYMLMSPDSITDARQGDPTLYLCEGPIDKLILEQLGVNSICFLGTSGFKEEYAQWLAYQRIFCIPDAEDNKTAKQANLKMYIKIREAVETSGIRVIDLSRQTWGGSIGAEPAKIDPASLFANRKKDEALAILKWLAGQAPRLESLEAWKNHLRAKAERERKRWQDLREREEVDKLTKFPILPTLELLGIEVLEGYATRPTCRCFSPEHDDTRPSVYIYEETQTFHCFGCGAGHDSIDAVRMVKGLEFKEAIALLKEELYEQPTSSL
jgi:hypothetical protein